MKRILIFLASALIVVSVSAQEKIHQASSFGIKSDGVTLNTRSIQAAIDYIGSHGGGVLEISVGRYLTGSIHLKSNVELRLLEGAVLIDSGVAFDPTAKEKADTSLSAEDRQIGGLGILLVRELMDSINYERIDGQNILTLIKKVK